MKLYLFGGAELQLGQDVSLKQLIKDIVLSLNPKFVLHVPFARLHPTEQAFREGWFKQLLSDTDIEILDARVEANLNRAVNPLVFINGGHGGEDLKNAISNSQKLRTLIINAEYIIGESKGSKITATYMRDDKTGDKFSKGLNILKDTIIEPHYSERHSEGLLLKGMQQTGAKYGIGIDCATGIVVDPAEFPKKWSKIGSGKVDVRIV